MPAAPQADPRVDDDEQPAVERPREPASRRVRLHRLFTATVLAYGALVVVSWVSIAWLADRFWVATLAIFGPRWVLAVPLMVLVPAALVLRRFRLLGVLGAAAVLVLWPIMGLELPNLFAGGAGEGTRIRVVTHNLDTRLKLDSPDVRALVADLQPDILGLQECRHIEPGSPSPIAGYHLHHDLNTCVLSKLPIRRVDSRNREDVWARNGAGAITLYELESPSGPVYLLNLHLETVREGLLALRHDRFAGIAEMRANIALRRWESEIAREWGRRAKGPLIVTGDLNMPVESAIYRDLWSDLQNAFSEVGFGYGDTKETRVVGVRIDHVLASEHFDVSKAWIGPATRSSHRPMVAELAPARPAP